MTMFAITSLSMEVNSERIAVPVEWDLKQRLDGNRSGQRLHKVV